MKGYQGPRGLTQEEKALFKAEYPERVFPFYYGLKGELLEWDDSDLQPKVKGLGSFAHVRLWLKVQRILVDVFKGRGASSGPGT